MLRREKLKKIVEVYGKSKTSFAKDFGFTYQTIYNNLTSADGVFPERAARRMETTLGLPKGYLDREDKEEEDRVLKHFQDKRNSARTLEVEEQTSQAETKVNPKEQILLSIYRGMSEEQQKQLSDLAFGIYMGKM